MTRAAITPATRTAARRWLIDLAMLAAIGLLMGFIAPFGWDRAPLVERYGYWMVCILGAGLIGFAADDLLRRAISALWGPALWGRVLAASLVATPPVALLVLTTQTFLRDEPLAWPGYIKLMWQAWPILLAVILVRALAWRRPPARIETRIETRTLIASPLPEAEAAFRQRLSAKRRTARLIAIEAHDHYLRVHTDAGPELITLRFADALDELARAHGWRVHRSWWVAADAVEAVRWRRGGGEIDLATGLTAPVSRTYSPVLKEAGWF